MENDPIPAVVRSHSFDESDWQEMASIAHALDATLGQHPDHIEALEPFSRAEHAPRGIWSPARALG